MLVQALYNIVDSIFVSWISEEALTAVTLAFPMQNLMVAVASGTAVGVNALLSRSLGEKKFEQADDAANTAIVLSFFSYLVFLLIGLLAAKPYIHSQTTSEVIREYGVTYTTICCCVSVGVFFQIMMERLLQSTGRTVFSMISQMTGAVINMIMDPILIFGWLGFPKLGIAGAALATVFGQVIASCLCLWLNLKFNKDIHLSLKRILHPKFSVIRQIYAVGIPSILMISIGSVMTFLMNRILDTFSTTATAVFGVYFKLQSFFFLPVFGVNGGLIPVLAYNFGARQKERIYQALSFSVKIAIVIMLAGTLCFELLPGPLLKIFSASDNMIAIGVPALRIIALHFPVAACCIVIGSVFQAFSQSIYSLIVSVCRQLVVLIPVAWLLSRSGVVSNVWWSFLIAEGASITVSLIFLRKSLKKLEAW
ncbi:MAG: MATE family efflux transporter [Eubacterium sp.]|nr:MATE family efflux transporter [Eubacterium sp.]